MSENVTPIRPPAPYKTGKAKCLSCRHEWIAVSPLGVVWFECPACGMEQGRSMGAVSREGAHWHCGCGNDLFYVTPDGSYCPVCGVKTNFDGPQTAR